MHSFFQEPEVDFQAESQFEGKNLPQLTSLIISHLRKSIQKKHTLPSYKIRYNPFFPELSPQDETQEVYVHDSLVTVGKLEVTVVGCSRLPELESGPWQYYCSVSVGSSSLESACREQKSNVANIWGSKDSVWICLLNKHWKSTWLEKELLQPSSSPLVLKKNESYLAFIKS